MPDPNLFSDVVRISTADTPEWRVLPESAGFRGAGRGVGLAEMAEAIGAGTPHRASGELAFHVLEVMEAVTVASVEHRVVEIGSSPARPAMVPLADVR
jgi:predicted dehydrogenase